MSRLHYIIEQKEDTAKKLAEAAGNPTKHYLFAPEINRLVNTVRSLMNMQLINDVIINQLMSQNTTIDFGEIETDIVDYINTQAEPLEIETTTYISYETEGVKYVSIYLGETAVYGSESAAISEDDLILVYDSSDEINQATESVFLGKLTVFSAEDYELLVDHNTMGNYKYTHVSAGSYSLKFAGKTSVKVFPSFNQIEAGKIETFVQPYSEGPVYGVEVLINVYNNAGVLADAILNRTIFQIQYYE